MASKSSGGGGLLLVLIVLVVAAAHYHILGGKPKTNVALGEVMATGHGWTGGQWACLYDLWQRESGWDNRVWNYQGSGAYGIAQALPLTKMPKAAWPGSYGGHSDARTQISWGLNYIAGRYGTPCAAWAHEQTDGWY